MNIMASAPANSVPTNLIGVKMSMHLEKPFVTTTRYGKKQKQSRNKRQISAEARHEKWLKANGLDDAALKKKLPYDAKGRRLGVYEAPNLSEHTRVGQSESKAAGNGHARDTNVYTGTLIKGIATMHKSNAVPVISKEDAIDIANMRRN